MAKELDIFLQEDGFYVGTQLKSGALSKTARRITEDEILTMFTTMMTAYCKANNVDNITMKDADGGIILAKKFPTELG